MYSSCEGCTLWESATHRGLPTRTHSQTHKKKAMVVVGEAPGYQEDQQSKIWVGPTGKLLSRFLEASKFSDYCDIYLTNACRCRPPQNATPNKTQQNACRGYLIEDLQKISGSYDEVILLVLGGTAVSSVLGISSLKESFKRQGQTLDSFEKGLVGRSPEAEVLRKIWVFCSYHPAMLLPGRKPALVTAVGDHFTLLQRYLTGEFIPNSLHVIPEVGTPPGFNAVKGYSQETPPTMMCVDIESYGILKGREQTVFHPTKSHYIDGAPLGDQIVTVSIGFPNPKPLGTASTFLYVWDDPTHRAYLREWFRLCKGMAILGQNIKFDLQYLRANDLTLATLITPDNYTLDDTLLGSFLLYEQRPEKGLKELATLFGLTDYSKLQVTGSSGTAKNAWDPELHYYNCMDVATTLELYKYCWMQIEKQYGKNSPKMSDLCRQTRNMVLWDVIGLESSGFCVNTQEIRAVHKEYSARAKEAAAKSKELGVIIKGEGSQASTVQFMTEALAHAGIIDDKRVKLTDKKRAVSVGEDNFNLLDGYLGPEDEPFYTVNANLKEYHKCSKIVNTYTHNLMSNPKAGIVYGADLPKGFCYPAWYPIPLNVGKSTGTEGGTIQGRFSCKSPAAQTYPPVVKHCVCSRFADGKLIGYDMSQIELRTGALLSGDPLMIKEYQEDIDRHTETALLVFPDVDVNMEGFRKLYRQAGKTLNFLVLYRGGALKFQETVMRDLGIHLELHECEAAIRRFDTKYLHFRAWQDGLIRTAKKDGYIVLPTGWSRSFSTGYGAETYINEICNFPIQTIAAQLMQSSQFAIQREMMRRRMQSRIVLQIHDALYADMPAHEESIVDRLMDKYLTRPPLLGILEDILGRTVPIAYEKESA